MKTNLILLMGRALALTWIPIARADQSATATMRPDRGRLRLLY